MSFTYDTTNNIGKVRAIVGDVTSATAVLSDEQINVFLALQNNDILKSAAMALRTMAASKATVAKMKTAGNYSESTVQIAKDLLALAESLEEMSNSIPADAQAEIVYNDFNYNQILRNRVLREEPLD